MLLALTDLVVDRLAVTVTATMFRNAGISIDLQQAKRFFFEKKNQKTFVPWVQAAETSATAGIKVFCCFFSKKQALLSYRFSMVTSAVRHEKPRWSSSLRFMAREQSAVAAFFWWQRQV